MRPIWYKIYIFSLKRESLLKANLGVAPSWQIVLLIVLEMQTLPTLQELNTGISPVLYTVERRPCTFGQSLWSTNCPVNFTFFWLTNFFFGRPKTNFSFFWSTNFFFWSTKNHFLMFLVDQFFFGRPNLFLVNQKKNWSTKKNEK